MLFFMKAILLCAVRDAQCKPGNHLNQLHKQRALQLFPRESCRYKGTLTHSLELSQHPLVFISGYVNKAENVFHCFHK